MQQIEHASSVAIDWRVRTALLLAFLVHNLEEALTFGAYRGSAQTLVRRLTSHDFSVLTGRLLTE